MNLDTIKNRIKNNPRTGCIIIAFRSLKDANACKKIIDTKTSPYLIQVQSLGELEKEKWIYYINIDSDYKYNGFCSLIKTILQLLAYAEFFGLTPVVNIGTSTMYFDKEIKLGSNVFEYFFEQVSEVNYKHVKKCKKVTISKPYDVTMFGKIGSYDIPDDQEISWLGMLYKKYFVLNSNTKNKMMNEIKQCIKGKTLGVHVRATDFNRGYNRHPIVVTPKEYLEETVELYNIGEYERIFLASDDQNVIQLFVNKLGEKVCFYKDTFRSNNGKAIHYNNDKVNRKYHKYLLGREIIRDYYTLGMCDGLIAGNSNVAICARIVKNSLDQQYCHLKIIDKGINHNIKEVRSLFFNMFREREK